MQSFGLINGTAGMIDDEHFASKDAAFTYAQVLAVQEGIEMIVGIDPNAYDD